MRRTSIIISILAVLLILAGCTKAECKKDVDCVKPHFTGTCVDKKCSWAPIPNECGNLQCEAGAKENSCMCPQDCGACEGNVGKHLVKQCNAQQECVEDIPVTAQKPITLTRELSTAGAKISVTTLFNQPFNLKKDQFQLEFDLNVLPPTASDLQVSRLELTGMTPDKRTVPLSDKTVNKFLYAEGSTFKEHVILDFPTAEHDGELSSLNLKIYLDYVLISGTSRTPKSTTLALSYGSLKLAWARPEKSPGCPTSCDDANPGTQDLCGPETNYFCENQPIAGACGNFVCDASENTCTCQTDCGPCSSGGTYVVQSCVNNACVSQIKPGTTAQPQSVFDERSLGPFELQNSYKYNKPFIIKTDTFVLEFNLYQKDESVSAVKIKDVRLLEGTQELAYLSVNKELTSVGQKEAAAISVPALGSPEQERNIVLRVWYEYVQGGQTKQGDYSKPLGKIMLLNPDV